MEFFTFISEQYLLVGVLLVLIYVFIWNEKRRGGKTFSSHQVVRMMNNDEAVLVDVRDLAEYEQGHIANALHLPHGKVQERWEELLPHKEKTVILVDKMGQHAGTVGSFLNTKEFNVGRLGGGMSEWQGQNLPVVSA